MSYFNFSNTPFRIRELNLPNRLIQAPLAGISCAPFRELFTHYQKPAYAVSEMVSAHSVLYQKKLHPRYLARSEQEGLYAIQLSGNEPVLMREAVLKITSVHQPDLIDLNCGCPMPKIRSKGCGSALLEHPEKLEAIIRAMRDVTHLPVTVKIRLLDNQQNSLKVARKVEQAGADALIIHGRTHLHDYDTPADYPEIYSIARAVDLPVIANGDICDIQSMNCCFEQTGADALMIGRASIGKPWLFQYLLEGNVLNISHTQSCTLFEMHINSLAVLERSSKTALLQARRLLKWYFPAYSKHQLSQLYRLNTLTALLNALR